MKIYHFQFMNETFFPLHTYQKYLLNFENDIIHNRYFDVRIYYYCHKCQSHLLSPSNALQEVFKK